MPAGDFLALRGIEVVEIGLGNFPCALFVDHLVIDSDGRIREDRKARHHDLVFAGAELFQRQERLVLPGDEDIADATLRECGRGTSSPGVQHFDVLIDLGHKFARLGFVAARLLQRVGPCCQIVPACAARGFGG